MERLPEDGDEEPDRLVEDAAVERSVELERLDGEELRALEVVRELEERDGAAERERLELTGLAALEPLVLLATANPLSLEIRDSSIYLSLCVALHTSQSACHHHYRESPRARH